MKMEIEKVPVKVTDIDDLKRNIEDAVMMFNERWCPMPRFDIGVNVMDIGQLRDAIGVRASIDWGDAWPTVERMLLELGFRWHLLGGIRVMYLKEKEDFNPATGWEDADEVKTNPFEQKTT